MRIPRLAMICVAAILLVVAGLGVARWRKRRAEQAEPATATGVQELARARAITSKLDRTVYVDPLPLTARLDARFRCGTATEASAFSCGGVGWDIIMWKLERDTSPDTVDAIIASARAQQSALDPVESGMTHEDLAIAGFRGFIDVNFAMRMPVTDVTFTGYRDDPRGRIKMTIYANGWRSEKAPPGSTDVADAVAIMLTTEVPPGGLASDLPDQQDIYNYLEASTGMGALLDDAKPAGWVDGAARFADAKSRANDRVRGYFSRVLPVMVDLLGRRIGAHAPDAAGFMTAVQLSESLFGTDAKEGTRAADDLARAIAGAWSLDAPDASDAGAWVEAELRLAALRTRISNDAGPSRDLALRLAPMDRRAVLRDPRQSLGLLAGKLRGAEAAKLLEAWMDPAGVPADADFGGVAAFALSHLRVATVRRHVLAMLADKRRAGEVESRTKDVLFRGASQHAYPATDLPPAKSTRDFRACDVYAGEAARVRDDVTFDAWANQGTRDAQIAAIRRTIASE